jgi:very-short-patch-repair endonuclease
MEIHSKLILKERRKELRNKMTPQEIILWKHLKNSQLGYKFQRQHSLGNFIADFYCPRRKLIVEADGSQHTDEGARAYDKERTQYLESLGVRVLRFWNNEINTNLSAVLDKIRQSLE